MRYIIAVLLLIVICPFSSYAWDNEENDEKIVFEMAEEDIGIHSSQFLTVMHNHPIIEVQPRYKDNWENDGFMDAGSPENPYVIEYKDSGWHKD